MSRFYLCRSRTVCINGRFDEMDILVEAPDNMLKGQLNRIVNQMFSPCLLMMSREVHSHNILTQQRIRAIPISIPLLSKTRIDGKETSNYYAK